MIEQPTHKAVCAQFPPKAVLFLIRADATAFLDLVPLALDDCQAYVEQLKEFVFIHNDLDHL